MGREGGIGRSGRLVALVLAGLALAACSVSQSGSTGELAALHVVNVDGPGVQLVLADKVVARVPCGGSATLVPGGQLPGLPWVLTVRADDGAVLRSVSIAGELPQGMVIRGRGVMTGTWPMSYGPAPSPLDAPCGTPS